MPRLGGGKRSRVDLINPLFFLYSLGQCQQIEESGKSDHYVGTTTTGKNKAPVYITTKMSVCIISYKAAWLPKGKKKKESLSLDCTLHC